MKATSAATLVALLVTGALLAACDNDGGENPFEPPGTAVGPTTPAQPDGSTTPRVESPLDPATFLDRPCDLLPEDWATSEGFEPGKPNPGAPSGPSCVWNTPVGSMTDEGTLHVIIETVNQKRGQATLPAIQKHALGQGGYFEPTTVAGYSAAFYDTQDRRAKGDTWLSVAIRDDLVLSITTSSYYDDPARAGTEALAAAEQMINTLKGAQ
ncbi:MAG: DUF3558 family protein [Thermocrispum sp.]